MLFIRTQPRTVECLTCGGLFQSVFGVSEDGKTQGDGCAASCTDGIIRCHYGSDLDGSMYNVPNMKDTDPICDVCIQGLIDTGVAEYAGDYLTGAK